MQQNNQQPALIGICGGGFQGQGTAFWFAAREFPVILYDIDEKRCHAVKINLNNHKKHRLFNKYITVTHHINDLAECDLIIENVTEKLEVKQKVFQQLETIAKKEAIFASNSSSMPPSVISQVVERKDRFLNLHYLGVTFGNAQMELIPGRETSEKTYAVCDSILKAAGFVPFKTGECPGFVFNRITLCEVANLFRLHEKGVMSLDNTLKYTLFTQMHLPIASLDFAGVDIAEAAIRFMNSRLGDRFYCSKVLAARVAAGEVGQKAGKGLLDHSGGITPRDLINRTKGKTFPLPFKRVFLNRLPLNHVNLLVRMMQKGIEVVADSQVKTMLAPLAVIDPNLDQKIRQKIAYAPLEEVHKFDVQLIIDCPPLHSAADIARRVAHIEQQGRQQIPLAVNLPFYTRDEIIGQALEPAQICIIHCQKAYLTNMEIMSHADCDRDFYQKMFDFVGHLSGDPIEVKDFYIRPLMFKMLVKMFEAARIVEEKVSTPTEVEALLVNDFVFRDMDYFGIDDLITIANHCSQFEKSPFEVPSILLNMAKAGHTGIGRGKGFYEYEN